jgi:hypothetical protein
MGGLNSGRADYADRWTVEENNRNRLRLSDLTQLGFFSAVGQRFSFWSHSVPLNLDIDLGTTPHVFIQATQQTIRLDSSRLYFGGERWFYRCPECDRRCRDLFFNQGRFLCPYDGSRDKHDRFFRHMAAEMGVSRLEARRKWREYVREQTTARRPRWKRSRDRRRYGSTYRVENDLGDDPAQEPDEVEAVEKPPVVIPQPEPVIPRPLPRKYGQPEETEAQRRQRVMEARRRNSRPP